MCVLVCVCVGVGDCEVHCNKLKGLAVRLRMERREEISTV